MKITETIERECCQPGDLRPYAGFQEAPDGIWFCAHCGQLWGYRRITDNEGAPSRVECRIYPGKKEHEC